MRLPWTRWQKTLSKLGLRIVWGARTPARPKVPTRHSQLEKLEGREMMASQINNLHFVNDTGTVGDGQSSDIRIGGNVSFTGTYMGQTLKVEFDHNNDGTVDGYVNASYMGSPFEYNPRTADASLNTFTGSLPMRVRVEELDSMGQSQSIGSWISFPITVLAPEPEIDVQDPGPYGMSNTSLPDNTGSLSFGSTAQGTPVSKTLNIKNLGQGPLSINIGSFSLPAGYTLVTPPASSIAAGSYSSFVIRMDATSPGTPGGVMTFTSNDADEGTYHLSLSGTVTGLSFSVNNLQLVTDNGYSSTDKVTSVPTVTGSVSYTGSYSGGTIRVEFDHNNDGVMEGYVNASPSMPFQYDARTTQPSLSTYNGTFTLRYRVVVLDMMSQPTYTGSWSSFVMTLENNSQPVLDVQDASNSTSIANNTGSVSFGTVNQGASVTKSFTIRNTGSATMTVNVGSFTLPAGFVLATSPSSTVAANGGSTTFSVRMDGTTAGSKSGRLTFTTNSTTATYDIGLSGTVNALNYAVNNLTLVNDTWINGDFITSDPRVTGTVTQTGTYSASRIDVEFDHNDDGVKEGAVTYASVGMSWQYDPRTSQPSLATATGTLPLRYRVVAYDTMSQAVFTGSWASLPIQLDNTPQPEIDLQDPSSMGITSGSGSVYFGSTTQGSPLTKTFTIRNTGPGALTVNPASLAVPSGFTVVTPPASTVSANGGTTTFTVRLDATTPGTASGTISFTNSDADEGTYAFSVSGTVNTSLAEVDLRDSSGTSLAVNATYNLGNATIGQSITKTLTIFNSGSGSLAVGTPVLSGSSAFSIVSSPMATVSPGSSTTVTIQFTPNLSGQVNGTLTFATNDADENPYVCNLVATGAAAPSAIVIGDMRLVSDTGTSSTDRVTSDPRLTGTIPLDANLSGGRVSIEFDHHGSGTASGNILAYSPGETFTYNPAQAEPGLSSYVGALDLKYRTVLYNAQGQAVASSSWVNFPITLEAAAAPKLVLSAGTTTILAQVGSFDFGTTPQGTPVDQVFTIRNTGTSNLAINLSSFQVPTGFTLLTPPAASVAPSGDTTFTVRMNAATLGMADGTMSFTSNDVDHGNYSFRIHGDTFLNTSILEVRKSSGQLVASGATLDLGSAYIGQSLTQTLTILNTGAAALNLDTLQMSSGMTVVTPFSGSVAPYGGSTTLTVRYSAAAAGSVVGTLSFSTNDPQRPTYQVQWLAETLDPAAGSSTTVTGLRLAFDSGSSDTDKQTYDPRLVGRLGAIVTGGTVEVQFDHNADGVAEGFALVAANGSDFTYDPRGCQPALSSYVGNVSLNYRAVLKDAGGNVLRTGAWQTFGFELVAKPTIPNLEISQLVLLQDSGSSNNDRITTNPTLYGVVRGTVTTGVARVEFDHNADGIADGHVDVTPGEAFTYDPRDSEPAYANRLGAQVLGYRLLKLAADGSVEATGAWDAIGLTLVAPPVSQITVGSLTLVHDDGGSTTSEPEILATQSGLVHEAISSDMLQLEVDINGDGLADDRVETTEGSTNYTYIPKVDSYGAKTLHFRFREWSSSLGTYLYGPWSSIAFTVVPAPAGSITDLKLTNDTGASDTDKFTLDGTVEGKLNGSLIAYQTIHVDLNGDNVDELTTTTDENGNFSFDSTSLVAGAVTARVRASRVDAISNATVFGPWASFAYNLDSAPLPTLPALTLLQDTGTAGDLVTSNPTVTGQIVTTQQQSGVLIQFDLNNSGVVTGQALTDDLGQFTYRPLNLAAGAVTVRARVAVANAQGVMQFGPWTGVSYTFEIPNAVAATITNLGLVHATGGTTGNVTTTSDPAISGVAHDGLSSAPFAAGVVIEVDQNNDGQVDAQTITNSVGKFQYVPVGLSNGTQTIQVRAKTWDYKNHTLIAGAWQPISFQLAPKVNAVPVLSSLGLLADTGSSQSDLVTANSMLVGQATNDGSAAGLTIELDTTGDSVADGLAYTGTDGSFTYSPVGLGFGTHTVRARAIEWDEAGGQYLFSPWKELTFVYENAVNTAAQIVVLQVVPTTGQESSSSVSSGPTIGGRVINESYLAGISVEFDWNSDGLVDATAQTDNSGSFQGAMVTPPVATVTVQARTREIDTSSGQVLVSGWSTLQVNPMVSANAAPTILTFEQAVTVAQAGVTLVGTASNDNGLDALTIQFDHDGDGIYDDSTSTDSQGRFSYVPKGLVSGPVTIRARAQETDVKGVTQSGPWVSLSLIYVDPASQQIHIDSVSLQNDTGASATDGSTSDGSVQGHIANTVSGTYVEYDTNRDGVADGVVLVTAQGGFQFTPDYLPEGYNTVSVRIQSTSSPANWQDFNFVYSSQPDSSQSQALVNTYQVFNANWATAQATYRAGVNTIEHNYRQAMQSAEDAYQAGLLAATGTRDQVVNSARATYNSILQAAKQVYVTALAAANAQLSTDLANFTGDKRSYQPLSFSWGAIPPSNSFVVPEDRDQPTSPALESGSDAASDADTYDFEQDSDYQAAIEQIKQEQGAAIRLAKSDYLSAKQTIENDYKLEIAPILAKFDEDIAAALATFNAERAQNAIDRAQLFDLVSKGEKLQAKVDAENRKLDKKIEEINARFIKLKDDRYNQHFGPDKAAIDKKLADDSLPLQNEALGINHADPIQQTRYEKIQDELRELQVTHDKAIADSDISFRYDESEYSRKQAVEIAEARLATVNRIADMRASFALEKIKATAWDDEKRIQAEQKQKRDIQNATATRNVALVAPDLSRANKLANAAEDRDVKVAAAATNAWLRTAQAKVAALTTWSNSVDTPGSRHQLKMAQNAATYAVNYAPAVNQRNQDDIHTQYDEVRKVNSERAILKAASLQWRSAQKIKDINSETSYKITSLPARYDVDTQVVSGRKVDLNEAKRLYSRSLNSADFDFAKASAEDQESASDDRAYNAWVAATAIADAVGDKTLSSSALEAKRRTIAKQNDLDDVDSTQSADKETAKTKRDYAHAKATVVAGYDQGINGINSGWDVTNIQAAKSYDLSEAAHEREFQNLYIPKSKLYADKVAEIEESAAKEMALHTQGFASTTSNLQRTKSESDAHADSIYREAMASRWTSAVSSWAAALMSRWATLQSQIATAQKEFLVKMDAAKEEKLKESNTAAIENIIATNVAVKKAADKAATSLKDEQIGEDVASAKFGGDLAGSRESYAIDLAEHVANGRIAVLNEDTAAANVIAGNWLDRAKGVATARYGFEVSVANATALQSRSRVNDLFDKSELIIDQATFVTRRQAAIATTIQTTTAAEGVRRTSVANAEETRANADAVVIRNWITNVDNSIVDTAVLQRDALVAYATRLENISGALVSDNAAVLSAFKKALAKTQRDRTVEPESADAALEKAKRPIEDTFNDSQDAAEDTKREDVSGYRSDYELGLFNDHLAKLVTAGTSQLSAPMQKQNMFEQVVAQSDVVFAGASKAAQAVYEHAISIANSAGGGIYHIDAAKDDEVAESTELADSREELAGNVADRDEARDVASGHAGNSLYSRMLGIAADADIARLNAGFGYEKKMAIATVTWTSTVAGAEKTFYLAQPYQGPEVSTEGISGIPSFGGVVAPPITPETQSLIDLRQAKQAAANTYANTEFAAALKMASDFGDADIAEAEQRLAANATETSTAGAAQVSHATGVKTDKSANAVEETAIETPHVATQRGFQHAEEDYNQAQDRLRSHQARDAQNTLDHSIAVATIAKLASIASGGGTLLGGLARLAANQLSADLLSTSKDAVFAAASAKAQADWREALVPGYANFVQGNLQSTLLRNEAVASAQQIQQDAKEAADDIANAASRLLEDGASDARFAAGRNYIENDVASNGQTDVEVAAVDSTYGSTMQNAVDQESVDKLKAKKVADIAKVQPLVLVGPFVNILDFSEAGSKLGDGVPMGPVVGSDGYPVAETTSGSGGGAGSSGGTTSGGGQTTSNSTGGSNNTQAADDSLKAANAQAKLDRTTAESVAWRNRTVGLATANSGESQRRAIHYYNEQLVKALITRDLEKSLSPIEETKQNSYAAIDEAEWLAETQANNVKRSAETATDNVWQNASYVSQSQAIDDLAQEMQLPWADYLSHRATAEVQWWQESGATQASNYSSGLNAADLAYRLEMNSAHNIMMHSTNAIDRVRSNAVADAVYAQAVDNLLADKNFKVANSVASHDYLVAEADLQNTYDDSLAHAVKDFTVSGDSVASNSAVLAADHQRTEASKALQLSSNLGSNDLAWDKAIADQASQGEYDTAIEQANNAQGISSLGAELTYRQALSPHYLTYITSKLTLDSNLTIAQEATFAVTLAGIAVQYPGPWAQFDASVQAASANMLATINPAYKDASVQIASANINCDISQLIQIISYRTSSNLGQATYGTDRNVNEITSAIKANEHRELPKKIDAVEQSGVSVDKKVSSPLMSYEYGGYYLPGPGDSLQPVSIDELSQLIEPEVERYLSPQGDPLSANHYDKIVLEGVNPVTVSWLSFIYDNYSDSLYLATRRAIGTLVGNKDLAGNTFSNYREDYQWVAIDKKYGGGRCTVGGLKNIARQMVIVHANSGEGVDEAITRALDAIRHPLSIDAASFQVGTFLDGTGNSLESLTNISRLYGLYIGTKFYNGGPGNSIDSDFQLDSGAGNSWDMIVARAKNDLEQFLSFRRENDPDVPLEQFKLDIFGFSRGAVMAVDLARQIQKGVHIRDAGGKVLTTPYLKVRFLGLFDPVSSNTFGGDFTIDNGLSKTFDSSKNMLILFIPSNVEHGLNLIAQHETRPLFPGSYAAGVAYNFAGQSRIDADGVYHFSSSVANVSVPGRHCDIGGFYGSNRFTQQISLAAMMQRARNAGVEFYDSSHVDNDIQRYLDSPFRRIQVVTGLSSKMHFRNSNDLTAQKQFEDFMTMLTTFEVLSPEGARQDLLKSVGSRTHFAPGVAGVQYDSYFLHLLFLNGIGWRESLRREHQFNESIDRNRDVAAPTILTEFFSAPSLELTKWFRDMHRMRPNPMGKSGFGNKMMEE